MAEIEFLKEALGDELFAQVDAKLADSTMMLADVSGGKYVPADKFSAERSKVRGLNSQIADLNSQIESLKGSNTDAQTQHEAKIAELNTANDAAKAQLEAKIAELTALNKTMGDEKLQYEGKIANMQSDFEKLNKSMLEQRVAFEVQNEARDRRAKDVDVVARMIDRDKITFDEEQNIQGVKEQFDELMKSYAYMFNDMPSPNGGFALGGNPSIPDSTSNSAVNDVIRRAAGL